MLTDQELRLHGIPPTYNVSQNEANDILFIPAEIEVFNRQFARCPERVS
jgi:hypothetical protein